MPTGTVRLHRVLRAKPEKVYRAFLDAGAIAKWIPPYGFTCVVHHMDPKVGGTFRMSFHNFSTGNGHAFGGEYKDLVPGKLLRYTDKFDDPNLPGEMLVSVELKPVLCGTEIAITQEGIPDVIPTEMCYLGWQESLAQLANLVEPEIPGLINQPMLTTDDVRSIPLFSALADTELAHLAETSADLHLAAGEFAVHEGGDRALYAVLSGRIEVVKLMDGIEKTLGWRAPGTIFGEVPIAFGTVFMGGYRASEPSRVIRVDPKQYYAVAATTPEIAVKVGTLARERIGGLQGLAAEPPKSRVAMVGNRWDAACGALRQFLARNQISYDWMTPDAPEMAAKWSGSRPVDDDCPVLRLTDGSLLTRPSTRELAERLGLQTRPRFAEYDTIIIGGGPAGLAAAVYGASEGLRTVVVEREAPGGQAGTSSRIENYLGFPSGVSGDELASRALQQARRLGAEMLVTRSVAGIDPTTRLVRLDGDEVVQGRTIILATGVTWRRLGIEGFDRLIGKGIYYGAARSEASATHGLDVHIIGAGNSAGQAALYFSNHARTVTLVVRGESLEKSMSRYLIEQLAAKSNVSVMPHAEVVAAHGDTHLTAIDIREGAEGKVQHHECGGLFIFIGADAETAWLPSEIARDKRGYVLTGDDVVKAGRWANGRDPFLLESSAPGIFACGDVRLSPVKRVASAVGEGSMAIAFVHKFLQQDAR